LTQPGDITMVEHAAMPKPTSYVREEIQKTVTTVDNRVGAPEVVKTRFETGMTAAPAVVQTTTTTQASRDDQAMAKAMYPGTQSYTSSTMQQPPVMGSTAVGNSMMGQQQRQTANVSSTTSTGSSGLGYHPLSPEGIEKATYASTPGQSSSMMGSSSNTSGLTTGEKVKAGLTHAKDVVQSKIEGTPSTTSTLGSTTYPSYTSGTTTGMGTTSAAMGATTTGSTMMGSSSNTSGLTTGEKIKAGLTHAKDVVQSKIEGTPSTTSTAGASGLSSGSTYGSQTTGTTGMGTTGMGTTTDTTSSLGHTTASDHPSLGERIKAKFEHVKETLTPGSHTSSTTTTQTKTTY